MMCPLKRTIWNVVGTVTLSIALLAGCSRDLAPADAIAQARQLIDAGKAGEASIRLRTLLAEHPDAVEARVLAAQLALDSGDIRGADAFLAQIPAGDLRNPTGQALRWWIDLGLGKQSQVLKELDESGDLISGSEQARIRASGLRGVGMPTEALVVLRNAVVDFPDDAALMVDVATTLTAIGNLRQAELELDGFIANHPRQADVLRARGELRLRNGATAKALEDLEAALATATPSWPIVKSATTEILLGEAALAAGQLDRARAQVERIEQRLPGTASAELLAARLDLLEGRAAEAADTLQRISGLMPDNAGLQYLLAEAWLRSGNTARATDLLERRVREGDNNARRMLAELLMRQSRPDRVIELLGELPPEPNAPNGDVSSTLLSTARMAQQRAGEVIATLESRAKENREDSETQVKLAAAYLQNGQASRALATLQQMPRGQSLPAAVAVELGVQFALRNDREVNRLVATLVDSDSTTIETLLAAADAAQEADQGETAARLIDGALRRDANNLGALLRRATLDFSEQRYDLAIATLEKLIQADPKNLQARLALARVAEAKGDSASVIATLNAAIKASPAALEPALMLAGVQLRAGDQEAAVRTLDAMIEKAAPDGAASNAAGVVLLDAGRAEQARTRFAQAIEQDSGGAPYWFNLGQAQLQIGDRQAASQSFARAVALQPLWVEANIAAVRMNIELRHYDTATQLAQALTRSLANEPGSWLLAGEAQLAEGHAEEAVAAFSRSYSLRPSALAALREYQARIAAGASRPEQPLRTWLTRAPDDTAVRQQLAQFFLKRGAMTEAAQQLEEVVRLAPNNVMSLNNLAWLVADTDASRAETLARRAYSITPQEPAIADTLGWTLIQTGKYPEAVEVLESAAKGLPQDRSVRYRYALALARSGNKEAARKELQAALAGDISFEFRDAAKKLSGELGS